MKVPLATLTAVAIIAALAGLTLAAHPASGMTIRSAARLGVCAYYKVLQGHGAEAVAVGSGVTRPFCRFFNRGWRGRRVYWRYGRTRCLFANHRRSINLALRTRNAMIGRYTCLTIKPALQRIGYQERIGP